MSRSGSGRLKTSRREPTSRRPHHVRDSLLWRSPAARPSFLVDWLWFGEVGYQPVYLTVWYSRSLVGGIVFVIAFAWMAAHLRHALNAASAAPASFTTREGFTIVLPHARSASSAGHAGCRGGGCVACAGAASAQWLTVLSWWHRTDFAATDPVLGRQRRRSTSSRCRSSNSFASSALPSSRSPRFGSAGVYVLRGRARTDPVRPAYGAGRSPARCRARGGLVRRARARRVARPAASARNCLGHHPGRQLHRCPCPHAAASRWPVASLLGAASRCSTRSAVRHGGWSARWPLYVIVLARRRSLRICAPAIRRDAQRAGARDAVHRRTTSRRRARALRSIASNNGS